MTPGEPQDARASGAGTSKNIPVGESIPNYFRAILSEEQFHQVQAIRSRNRNTQPGATGSKMPTGRTGARFSNLLQGLATCGTCGGTMVFVNKGLGKTGRMETYLVCDDARRGVGKCQYRAWRYDFVERTLLTLLKDLTFVDLFPQMADSVQSAGGSVQAQLDAARGPLTEIATKKENVVEHLMATSSPTLRSKLVELEKQEAAVAEQIETKTHALAELTAQSQALERDTQELIEAARVEYVRLVRDGEQEDVYAVRARLRQRLKQAIEFVSFDTNDQTFDPMWEAPHLVELTDKFGTVRLGLRHLPAQHFVLLVSRLSRSHWRTLVREVSSQSESLSQVKRKSVIDVVWESPSASPA